MCVGGGGGGREGKRHKILKFAEVFLIFFFYHTIKHSCVGIESSQSAQTTMRAVSFCTRIFILNLVPM